MGTAVRRALVAALATATLAGPQASAAPVLRCDREDVALFHVRAHDRIAIRVSRVDPGEAVEFDGPGFYRVRHANRRGRAVVRVRPRRSGRAAVSVQCNDSFKVRVTEAEEKDG